MLFPMGRPSGRILFPVQIQEVWVCLQMHQPFQLLQSQTCLDSLYRHPNHPMHQHLLSLVVSWWNTFCLVSQQAMLVMMDGGINVTVHVRWHSMTAQLSRTTKRVVVHVSTIQSCCQITCPQHHPNSCCLETKFTEDQIPRPHCFWS